MTGSEIRKSEFERALDNAWGALLWAVEHAPNEAAMRPCREAMTLIEQAGIAGSHEEMFPA